MANTKYPRSCVALRKDIKDRLDEISPPRGFSSTITLMIEMAFEAGLVPTKEEIRNYRDAREQETRSETAAAPAVVEEFGCDIEEFGV